MAGQSEQKFTKVRKRTRQTVKIPEKAYIACRFRVVLLRYPSKACVELPINNESGMVGLVRR